MEAFRKVYPSEFYAKYLHEGVRPDGRSLSDVRKTTCSVGSIATADGSAFVRTGNTAVLAGVRGHVASSAAKCDRIIVNVELLPLCSERFGRGPPSVQAQVLCEWMNRYANSDNVVTNLEEFTVERKESEEDTQCMMDVAPTREEDEGEGETHEARTLVWYFYVDIYCLDYDGNAVDACFVALNAALRNVHLPRAWVDATTSEVVASQDTPLSLSVGSFQSALTFGIIDGVVIADPTAEEESLIVGSVVVVVNEKGELCGVQKVGRGDVSESDLRECIRLARERVGAVSDLIRNASALHLSTRL
eukprot:TRINITY_DN2032_c0_g2_i1.p1 TRINITY_DN2032_c0_g2~~TRINITY_DN2032_c0_g2_i1.p1  ORF type:complete len:350 (-),score=66.22 TRINITY_DN2032_c0_g2_i1:207-1118(-)